MLMRHIPGLPPRTQRGFSLIELMVAMIAGLIVIGSTLAFTVATMRTNAENLSSARLSQDLRTALNLVAREIRRSGYDALAADRTSRALSAASGAPGSAYPTSRYATVTVTGSCVVFEYHRPAGGNQFKGFRLSRAGNLQHVVAATAPACTADAGWVDITDANVVQITGFELTSTPMQFSEVIQSTTVAGVTTATTANVTVRTYTLQITGALRNETSIRRTMSQRVRVRSDIVSLVTTVTGP
jgi:prepilin-type N-terminal cleavage/methylation domain-containing protein